MHCNFCGNPAAHPATGSVYGPSTIACHNCAVEAMAWVRSHTNKKARRAAKAVPTAMSFYEAAAYQPPPSFRPVPPRHFAACDVCGTCAGSQRFCGEHGAGACECAGTDCPECWTVAACGVGHA